VLRYSCPASKGRTLQPFIICRVGRKVHSSREFPGIPAILPDTSPASNRPDSLRGLFDLPQTQQKHIKQFTKTTYNKNAPRKSRPATQLTRQRNAGDPGFWIRLPVVRKFLFQTLGTAEPPRLGKYRLSEQPSSLHTDPQTAPSHASEPYQASPVQGFPIQGVAGTTGRCRGISPLKSPRLFQRVF